MMSASRGYVGLSDPEWYGYLVRRPHLDEVNFWQPHGGRNFRAIDPGSPFFFKLRSPLKAIAGFGFFQRYESLPAWLAWKCFQDGNGAGDFESMIRRINRLRKGSPPSQRPGDFAIGCIMISAPMFFPQTDWVSAPSDWAATGIQQGKTYQLDTGEGLRIWTECLNRATMGTRYWNVESVEPLVAGDAPRYGPAVNVRPRLGQGLFSLAVRDAYRGACAVTNEHSIPVLEAAHILPYSDGGEHCVDNGLLLRRDLHCLFDRGYVTVSPDYVFRVGDSLRDEFHNGRTYYELHDRRIEIPEQASARPSRQYLEWHRDKIFRG
jgi:putative restriction endonuclease